MTTKALVWYTDMNYLSNHWVIVINGMGTNRSKPAKKSSILKGDTIPYVWYEGKAYSLQSEISVEGVLPTIVEHLYWLPWTDFSCT
jgi:hypothetical protein